MRPCPLCAHDGALLLFEKDGRPYERCFRCGLVTRGGADDPPSYHDYLPEQTTALPPLTRRRYEGLLARLARYRRSGGFLDVGCGGGFLVEAARDLGWQAEGTEVSGRAVEFGRARGLRLHRGTLEDVELPGGGYDVVTLMEVIEHVPDPVALLRRVRRLLRPGGALYLTTPNWGSLTRRVMGPAWPPVGPDHVLYLTPRHLRRLLAEAGFARFRVTSANVQPGAILRHLRRPPKAPATPEAGPAGHDWQAVERLRTRVETNPLLRTAKRLVNAALSATGTGDTLRALGENGDTGQ